jgi:hypothetical protein
MHYDQVDFILGMKHIQINKHDITHKQNKDKNTSLFQ